MPLINCMECSKKISDKATSCSNCGCPIVIEDIENDITIIENKVFYFQKGIQNLYLRCSCGYEFKYMNISYKRTILDNGDYSFKRGLPIVCPPCHYVYEVISFEPVENIATQHANRYKTEVVECIACNGKVSNKAKLCPHCGSDNIVKIGVFSKGAIVWAVGAFASNTVLNDFKCNKCCNKFK